MKDLLQETDKLKEEINSLRSFSSDEVKQIRHISEARSPTSNALNSGKLQLITGEFHF